MHKLWQTIRTSGLLLSLIAAILSAVLINQHGLVLGQDFTGGYVSEFQLAQDISSSELHDQLTPYVYGEFRLSEQGALHWQLFQPPHNNSSTPLDWHTQLPDDLGVEILDSRYVGAQIGAELIDQGGLALLVSLLAVGLYLIVRFEWRLAVSASLALLHDVLITLGFFAATGMEFDLTVLAALLAIIGYSLNDSIVIGDKVRELVRARPDSTVSNTINAALGSTLGRTAITSLTTLTTIAALWWLGGASLQGFASALFIGVTVGTWSSVFVSATLPQWLGLSHSNYQRTLSEQEKQQLAEP
ncbi:protein translocase subunit SecF [Pseudoalteromonas ardens]|uniref:Protein-export membrane protein SecF n=1 Tax=Pseudoalteromonas rubra TaxID=43658 RepID=A0A0L0EXR2_9GAMM|nr:protein translocase subunit SecF [Pseudoalteromonas sp. R96]KNC69194.1 preprotein translocase subunit SecF [Pseudoalteromonas rubra]MDK1311859.1 protein translocase subunit SecF [Pseudoalteromonas sp. R96]